VTKPVAVFRSKVIRDPGHAVRLDENSHLVLLPSFRRAHIASYFPLSAGISPHGRYQPHGQWRHLEAEDTGRDQAYGWLSVGYHVSGASGLEARSSPFVLNQSMVE
jgi:hypothetical protein